MPLPRLHRLLCVLAYLAVACFALQVFSDNKADVDLWGNVGFVRALPGTAAFHTTNTFSYTEPDAAWINHEWLAEYVMYHTWLQTGNTGLLLLKLLLGFGVLGLMYAVLRQDCRSGAVRCLFMLMIISTMSYGFSTRPHHFTYLFLALFLYLLKRFGGQWWLHGLLLPLLGVAWANLHGAFFIGALVLLVHAVGESVGPSEPSRSKSARALILFGGVGLFVVASWVNPYGWHLWHFVFESGAVARTYLSEWEPFSLVRYGWIHPDFIGLVVLVGGAYLLSRTPKRAAWTALLALSLIGAIMLRRNIPLFAIVAGFAAGRHVDGMAGQSVDRLVGRVPRGVWAVAVALFIPLSLHAAWTFNKTQPLEIEVEASRYPLRTVRFMKTHKISGNLFVFFDWAEYCIWHLYPDCRVFMDGRFLSAYSKPVVEDYLAGLYGGPGWERVLTAYPTDMVLVHHDNPLTERLRRRRDWVLIHADGPAMLFMKQSAVKDVPTASMPDPERRTVDGPAAIFP